MHDHWFVNFCIPQRLSILFQNCQHSEQRELYLGFSSHIPTLPIKKWKRELYLGFSSPIRTPPETQNEHGILWNGSGFQVPINTIPSHHYMLSSNHLVWCQTLYFLRWCLLNPTTSHLCEVSLQTNWLHTEWLLSWTTLLQNSTLPLFLLLLGLLAISLFTCLYFTWSYLPHQIIEHLKE